MKNIPKVIFKFDKEKDIWNIHATCNYKAGHIEIEKWIKNKDILRLCENKKLEEVKEELKQRHSKLYDSGAIEIFCKAVQQYWNKINDEYFKRLSRITKKPIFTEKFTGYTTIVGRCPYSTEENWFMFSLSSPILNACKTTGHEIMHLQFHNYYDKEIIQEIGKEKTWMLKEALTVLLNLEFRDLWFVKDEGYKPHQELRNFIEETWKKKKDFDYLLRKCIKFLKNNSRIE